MERSPPSRVVKVVVFLGLLEWALSDFDPQYIFKQFWRPLRR
ncbi:hypothetical protein N8625_00040 [bacterium]|nr:hypothetical protein [bacterium]